jgi:hypothetical protein
MACVTVSPPLRREHFPGFEFHCETAADSVIAELGLKREWDIGVAAAVGRDPLCRYVTDWKADDE